MAKVVKISAQNAIESEARKWLLRMDGDKPLTKAEKKALKEWMSCSVLHREELIRIAKCWKAANVLSEFLADLESESWQRGGRHERRTDTPVYESTTGLRTTVFLSDGSSIQLYTDSKLSEQKH